ncbi:MAG: 30S ribosomal protein S6e [Candidatus Nezhaarchaeales archaeon]|nr:MAG: 30S ribosomal protein S6e [Candidatus Nezhaarchaeota archaeon WYZ-LMO8]TDA36238.1 MAG: 30S ribosomal protein S6e [Candidatus Nezhaarchaeota archaeon WYZ-LMO7]
MKVTPEFKVVVSDPSTGKAQQVTVSGPQANALIGLRIGDEVDGALIGVPGVRLVIKGGSDRSGAPMRADLPGPVKRRLLLSQGPGFRPTRKGLRKRKLVRGNTVSEDIVQINMVIKREEVKHG